MTTPSYGETNPLATSTDLPESSSPIGDELAHDTGLTSTTGSGSSAKETAQEALGSASEHASSVADTAMEEATKVASEAKDKAADLLADLKSQVDEQSKTQLKGLATKLGELADELDSMVTGSDANGTVTGIAQQLADKTHQLSAHLEGRQPMDLVEDVRGFARRRPAAFLAGSAVVGVLAGRLTRGAKATPDSGSAPTATPAATPTPAPTYAPPTGDPITSSDFAPGGQNTGGRQ
ncbi:hypothetical protein GEV29_06415 [Aeromicrobium sp. SMF47]|uniref:Uncharacterized protein n=1 Tax=Aeromicrobium yanjiei TaxID=2662028 RepID=A0A5Q2MN28_9ACTN|nr:MULTISPECIES: hypothetical protein [Aeromicrobium]MRJ76164.1 hypothetical protein [Aeromicrobium yanjiei]MRK00514.1 hypothetical protein [Aeromicrobium sp. S22]QGG42646.1 hypothetical protein GEV26_15375 [Aeromicrobium yanjiei]